MPGLDPGIHQSSQEFSTSRWIAGSSPAMTTTIDISRNAGADIRLSHRYINRARHVRAFAVGMD
jgi:hypothetical protein